MSVRNIILAVAISIGLSACILPDNDKDKALFEHFSAKEKDSIAEHYHKMSKRFLQPSSIHRQYKDSALMAIPSHVDYRQRLSYSYKKVGDHIKAMEILDEAVSYGLVQNNTDVLGYRAWTLLYYYRDYEGAIQQIDQIEEMTGVSYNVCWGEPCGFQKGQAYYRLGNYTEAIAAFDQVLSDEEKKGFDTKDNIYIFFYKGRCFEEKGDYEQALEQYDKALTSHKNFAEVFFRKGEIYAKRGEKQKAFVQYEKAKELLPYKMQEPYIERFDELFEYMVIEAIDAL